MKYFILAAVSLVPILFCSGCCEPYCLCPETVSTSICHGWEKEPRDCRCHDKSRCHCGKQRFDTVEKDTEICVKAEWRLR